jgi:hypothetical protein
VALLHVIPYQAHADYCNTQSSSILLKHTSTQYPTSDGTWSTGTATAGTWSTGTATAGTWSTGTATAGTWSTGTATDGTWSTGTQCTITDGAWSTSIQYTGTNGTWSASNQYTAITMCPTALNPLKLRNHPFVNRQITQQVARTALSLTTRVAVLLHWQLNSP